MLWAGALSLLLIPFQESSAKNINVNGADLQNQMDEIRNEVMLLRKENEDQRKEVEDFKRKYQQLEKDNQENKDMLFKLLDVYITTRDLNNKTALHRAVQTNDLKAVKNLLDFGADSKEKTEKEFTPLHLAFEDPQGENLTAVAGIVDALLGSGAEIHAVDQYGRSALYKAIKRNQTDAAIVLIEHGSNVNEPDIDGRRPLMTAVEEANLEIVKSLLKSGSDVNALQFVRTPLIVAAGRRNPAIVKLLLDNGADPNPLLTLNVIWNPLHGAAFFGDGEAIRLLLEYGAEINAIDSRNRTALSVAAVEGRREIIDLLLKHGAKE